MTADQLTDPAATTTAATGWGVVTTAPNGRRQYDTRHNLLCAFRDAQEINRPYPGTAAVVYREEEYGPWTPDLTGDEFGTEYRWPNGHSEVEPARSRADADAHARLRNARGEGATARTVSRRVKLGRWLPFTPARPEPVMPTWLLGPAVRPARRPSWLSRFGG